MNELVDILYGAKSGLPELDHSVVLLNWKVKKNQAVCINQAVAELETNTAKIEIGSPVVGRLQETLVERGQNVRPGQIIGRILVDTIQPDDIIRGEDNGSTDSEVAEPDTSEAVLEPDAAEVEKTATTTQEDEPKPVEESVMLPPLAGVLPQKAQTEQEVENSETEALPALTENTTDVDAPAPATKANNGDEMGKLIVFEHDVDYLLLIQEDDDRDIYDATDALLLVETPDSSELPGTFDDADYLLLEAEDEDVETEAKQPEEPEARQEEQKESVEVENAPQSAELPINKPTLAFETILSPTQRQTDSAEQTTATTRNIEHSRARKAAGAYLTNTLLHQIPHVSTHAELDLTKLISDKRQTEDQLTALFVGAVKQAMSAVPTMNSHYNASELVLHDNINIGFRSVLSNGKVVTPVLSDAQNYTDAEIVEWLRESMTRAQGGIVRAEDLRGGTFTIFNYGALGSKLISPIAITHPQVAILGVGVPQKRPKVVENDNQASLSIGTFCDVTLTVDGRAIGEHETARWLDVFKQAMETTKTASV